MPTTTGMGTIQVTFTKFSVPAGSPLNLHHNATSFYVFSFNPTVLTLPKNLSQYEVAFQLTTNVAGATIVVGDPISGPQPPKLVSSALPSGLLLTFTNSNKLKPQQYNYELSVQLADGTIVTSSDPEIVIPPGP